MSCFGTINRFIKAKRPLDIFPNKPTRKLPRQPTIGIWTVDDLPAALKIQHVYEEGFESTMGMTGLFPGCFADAVDSAGGVHITYQRFRNFVEWTSGANDGREDSIDARVTPLEGPASSGAADVACPTLGSSPVMPFPEYTEPRPIFRLERLVAIFEQGTAREHRLDITECTEGVFESVLYRMKDAGWTNQYGFRAEWRADYDF